MLAHYFRHNRWRSGWWQQTCLATHQEGNESDQEILAALAEVECGGSLWQDLGKRPRKRHNAHEAQSANTRPNQRPIPRLTIRS
jgi:hypothetical protein